MTALLCLEFTKATAPSCPCEAHAVGSKTIDASVLALVLLSHSRDVPFSGTDAESFRP